MFPDYYRGILFITEYFQVNGNTWRDNLLLEYNFKMYTRNWNLKEN